MTQKGFLIKVSKGIYRYDPAYVHHRELEDFTEAQKQVIFKRDNFFGRGTQAGIELHADHIKPKELGGKATIENGQTLCAQHNFMKKNLKQTETGKKMFIRLYKLSKNQGDSNLQKFCIEILKVYERNNINGHIEWNK
ncbi:MAG: HNH endonuclease [Chitinophagaceae bacterium]